MKNISILMPDASLTSGVILSGGSMSEEELKAKLYQSDPDAIRLLDNPFRDLNRKQVEILQSYARERSEINGYGRADKTNRDGESKRNFIDRMLHAVGKSKGKRTGTGGGEKTP